jgi:hypothetical protein
MKSFIVVVLLLLTGLVFAEPTVRVNRIDMAVTAPDDADEQTDETAATPGTKSQEYNSSRSNNSSRRADAIDHNASRSNTTRALDPDDDGDSLETEACVNGVDNDCDDTGDTSPAKRNNAGSR